MTELFAGLKSPSFVVDEEALEKNASVLGDIQRRTGCRILLALKAFSMWKAFPVLKDTLKGVCASSLHEARLGREEFGGEVHVFAAAYSPEEFSSLLNFSDHIVFNSFAQLERFLPAARPFRGPITPL